VSILGGVNTARARTMRCAVMPVALVAATVALAAAPAAGAATLQLRSFSSSLPFTPPTAGQLSALKQQQCVRKSKPASLGFSAGLKQARTALSGMASKRAVNALGRDKQTHNPRQARALAAAALIENRPAAALAALLDAQRDSPRDPQTLADLASVLIQLQMPSQALAVLGGIKHLGGRLPTPMGIPLQAVLLNDRGLALLRLGQGKQAAQLFRSAMRQAPLMNGVNVNLAVAQLCAGGSPSFPPPWDPPLIEPPIKDPSTGTETPQAGSSFDLSQGVTGTLPFIPYPGSYQQTAATDDIYRALSDQYYSQIGTDASQSVAATNQYLATHPSKLTDQRTTEIRQLIADQNLWPSDIASLANAANDPPSAVAAAGVPDEFQNDLSAASDACSGADDYEACYDPKCQAAASARNSEWRTDMVTWDNAERAYFAAYYKYATGLAANLSIPGSHQGGLIDARAIGDAILGDPLGGLPAEAHMWADMLVNTDCLQPPADPQATGAGSVPASSACSNSAKALKAEIDLVILKLSVECEKFGVSIGTPGPVGLFAEASFSPRTGQTTIFAGAKAGLELPGGFGESSKTGLYVTAGSDGSITDVGGRFSQGATTGGTLSANASDSMDFSFVPSDAGGSLLSG
jgi:hypothetical protein